MSRLTRKVSYKMSIAIFMAFVVVLTGLLAGVPSLSASAIENVDAESVSNDEEGADDSVEDTSAEQDAVSSVDESS